jgi:alpha-mannosidase
VRPVTFAAPVLAAREVNGQEQPVGPARIVDGKLQADFTPYQPRTFAVKLASAPTRVASVKSQPVVLDCNRSVSSLHGKEAMIGFDDIGNALPGELLPKELFYNGVRFVLKPGEQGKPNALETQG